MKYSTDQLSVELTRYCKKNKLVWLLRCQPDCDSEFNLNIWDMGGKRLRADIYGSSLADVLEKAVKRIRR